MLLPVGVEEFGRFVGVEEWMGWITLVICVRETRRDRTGGRRSLKRAINKR